MGGQLELAFRLARRRSSVPRARALLRAALDDWGIGQDVADTGVLIISELVTNALRVRAPGDRQVGVRIVRSAEDGTLRLEVSDAGHGKPEARAPSEDETCGRGLMLVEALAQRWGVEPRVGGLGKTVWVELKAPVPKGTEVAAATIRPGQDVRLWGSRHTARTAGDKEHLWGGPAVVLGLDDGSALRLYAAEQLTVQDDGAPFAPEDRAALGEGRQLPHS